MFVFKAAVVGAGTMGGEIAQTIAARRHPRRAQGRRPAARRAGAPEGALAVAGPGRRRQARARRARAQAGPDHRHHRLRQVRRRRLRDRGRARAAWSSSRRCSPSSTRSPPVTPSWPPTPRRCRSPRWARRPAAPTRWSAFTSSTRPRVMRLIEVVEGEDTSAETAQAAANFAQAIRKTADPLRRGAGVRGQPDPQLERLGAVALPGGDRTPIRARQAVAEPRRADGPFYLADLLGSTPSHVAEHLHEPTATASTSTQDAGLVAAGTSAQDREGLL